jgi:tetratricopeptide (TPR) repeat protein
MCKRAIYQGVVLFFLAIFGAFLLLPPSTSFAKKSSPKVSNGLIQIKAENGLLSVKLENAQLRQVLQEIAHQTGVQFVGWKNAEGTVTQQFDNVPLDEGLKRISQSFIMVLKKTGEEGKPLRVEKVIIIAQKDSSSTDSSSTASESKPNEKPSSDKKIELSKKPESLPSSPPASSPTVQLSAEKPQEQRAQEQVTLPPQKAEEPSKESTQVSKAELEKTTESPQGPAPVTVQEEALKPVVSDKPESNASMSAGHKGKGKKKKGSTVKTASLQSSTSVDRARGEESFKQKRWDKVVTYFGKYLEQDPSDQEIQEKLETAKQNAAQAISLYQQGRKYEDEKNFESAYEYYKKSCDIYPLVYDAWERMKAAQQKMKK